MPAPPTGPRRGAGASGDRKSTRLNSSHRDLHSFPTRRSSDLSTVWSLRPRSRTVSIMPGMDARAPDRTATRSGRFGRSEEHTSELQSPRSTLFPYTTLFRSLDRLVVEAQVEDRLHHAGHGCPRPRPDRDEERALRVAQGAFGDGFELREVLEPLRPQCLVPAHARP